MYIYVDEIEENIKMSFKLENGEIAQPSEQLFSRVMRIFLPGNSTLQNNFSNRKQNWLHLAWKKMGTYDSLFLFCLQKEETLSSIALYASFPLDFF